MAVKGFGATALTGGTTGCLDAINGALLSDGDCALVKTATFTYEFMLDADSAAAEASPEIISPDTNAGDKRWVRVKTYLATPGDFGQTTPAKIAGTQIRWAKGADVASANALTLGTDGNYFDITGTTAITSIGTLGAGAFVILHFDGALTLTHHATDLILPGAANITTAAGDEAMFEEYAAGDWRCVSYSKADGTPIAYNLAVPGDIGETTPGSVRGTNTEIYKTENADSPLTAAECSGTIVSNYGMTDADCVITLPTAAEGLAFLCILPAVRARYFRLNADTNDKIYLDGVAGSDAEYIGVASGYATGASISMFCFKASDGGFDWFAIPLFGTWVAE